LVAKLYYGEGQSNEMLNTKQKQTVCFSREGKMWKRRRELRVERLGKDRVDVVILHDYEQRVFWPRVG